MGYFRDDTPLMELILDEKGQKELDRLWDEFDFIADYTARTWVQYFFNQSGEVHGKGRGIRLAASARIMRSPTTAVIMRMRDAYLAKAQADPSNDPVAPKAIRDHFERVNATLRDLEKEHADAEPKQLDALLRFAARAYRRPLTKAERDDLLAYYHDASRQERALARRRHPRFDCQRADVARFSLPDRPARRRHACFDGSIAVLKTPPRCQVRAVIRLRAGEQVELLPVVQHARRGAVAARGGGRSAKARRSAGADPPHAEG